MRWFMGFVLAVAVGVALYTWSTLNYVYAQGERAGYVQKFSKKGWIFKTWEGELAMANLPGAMPEIFKFSVRNAGAVQQIQNALGQRVVLHYNQHRGIPTNAFGETSYFATSVQPVQDTSPTPRS